MDLTINVLLFKYRALQLRCLKQKKMHLRVHFPGITYAVGLISIFLRLQPLKIRAGPTVQPQPLRCPNWVVSLGFSMS